MNPFHKACLTIFVLGVLPGTSAMAAGLLHGDKSFLEDAAHAGHTEVEGSKLAQRKSSNPAIKTFADQMVKDHIAVGQELDALAKSKNLKAPTEPSLFQKANLKALEMKDGESFDRAYASEIGVEAHEKAVKLFEKASEEAKDPEVKAFADKNLPALRHHLDMARELGMKVGVKK